MLLRICIIVFLCFRIPGALAESYDDVLAAVRQNDVAAAEALFTRGVDVNTSDPGGSTLLMIAVQEGHTAMAERLDSHAPEDFRDRQARNRWLSAWIILLFLILFLLVGLAVDYLYLDAFIPSGPAFPWATALALGFVTAEEFDLWVRPESMVR